MNDIQLITLMIFGIPAGVFFVLAGVNGIAEVIAWLNQRGRERLR